SSRACCAMSRWRRPIWRSRSARRSRLRRCASPSPDGCTGAKRCSDRAGADRALAWDPLAAAFSYLAEASWRRRWRAREQGVEVRDVAVRERARLDLEAVVPVSVSQPFARIASQGEGTRLPLTDDVAVLVQHEPGVGEELGGAAGEIDAAAARGRDRAPVGSRIPGVLDDPHVADARAEHPLERFPHSLRHLSVVSGPHRTAFAL